MSRKVGLLHLFVSGLVLISCGTTMDYSPKPKGYNRIDLPKQEYQPLLEKHPYFFEYSKHAIVEQDTFGQAEPHWIIIKYPKYDAIIQFTYKHLGGDLNKLSKHIDDAYKLAAKHQVKADAQEEKLLQLKNGKQAVVIELYGEVPSHYQFYMTDTSQHYLRGALYLREPTLNDSLSPLVDYLKEDCRHILETLTWN